MVAVGRYTSPDHMAALVRKEVVDFMGAARPSIADPRFCRTRFPKKGAARTFRECIGCNICASGDRVGVPIRCDAEPDHGRGNGGWQLAPLKKFRRATPTIRC